MEKIWRKSKLLLSNFDSSLRFIKEGDEININDFIEENINPVGAKRLRLFLIGYSKETTSHPAIFEALVDPNESIIKQLSALIEQTLMG